MGFIGKSNIILNSNINIDKRSEMSYLQKISYISTYNELPGISIIEPTKMVCKYFCDKIGYCQPSSNFWSINDNRLEVFTTPLNLIELETYEDVLNYLKDDKKKIYLSKIVKTNKYSLYCYEINNIDTIRNDKIDKILNEGNLH